jgi:hypothetical protein
MKIYNLNVWENWFTKIYNFFRKHKLKLYKNKKIQESKTKHHRMYHAKFYVHVEDPYNPQVSATEYEMVIPAQAAYFARKNLEVAIKRKVTIQISKLEEMTDDEFDAHKKSEYEYGKSLEK